MGTEVDLDTGKLVSRFWVLGGRELDPGASLGFQNVQLVKFTVHRAAQLDQFCLIAQNIALHQRVDPVWTFL